MLRKLQRIWMKTAPFVSRGAMLLIALFGLSSAAGAHRTELTTVNDRIARIRTVVREREQAGIPAARETSGEVRLAQWGNWPNWGNWNNWGNWGNWGNGG